jgi:hypothetical protein
MSTLAIRLRGLNHAGWMNLSYPDARDQALLAVFVLVNLGAAAIAFPLEGILSLGTVRIDASTPGWCFVLAQAGVLGFVAALTFRGAWMATVQGLMAATLLGYAYVYTGQWWIDERRILDYSHLVYRGLEIGMVSFAALILGVGVRLIVQQRMLLQEEHDAGRASQYSVRDLLFLMAVFAVGMGFVNLFFNHSLREEQLLEVGWAVLQTLPAAVPWLWVTVRRRLPLGSALAILAASLLLIGANAVVGALSTTAQIADVVKVAALSGAAFAVAGAVNGLVLRWLGFRCQRG